MFFFVEFKFMFDCLDDCLQKDKKHNWNHCHGCFGNVVDFSAWKRSLFSGIFRRRRCTNAGCRMLMGFSSSGTFGRRRDLQYWFYGCSTKNRVFSFSHAQLTGFSHNFEFLVETQKSTTNASWTDQLRCHVELDPAYPFPSLLSLGVTNEDLHPLNHHAYLPRCS